MQIDIGFYRIRDWKTSDTFSIAKYANNKQIWKNLRDGFPFPYNLSEC